MEKVDITIIGAGIAGLAVASELSSPERSVYVIEKNESFGMETSSRNSEVIHAGIYYPTGSLKHQLCIEGNRKLYRICRDAGIGCRQSGKFIVAADEEGSEDLHALYVNGRKNEVPGLSLVAFSEVKEKEPAIKCVEAIYSSTTGIIDTHEVMKYFTRIAKDNSADIVYNTEVVGIEKNGAGGYIMNIRENTGEQFEYRSGIVINCAGLDADSVAAMVGIDTGKEGYDLKYCKGSYFRLRSEKMKIEHLIYPSVSKKSVSLGIHVTPDMGGEIRLGPDAEYLDDRTKDYQVDENKKEEFYNSLKEFLPLINAEDLHADTAGIRPKLQGPGEDFRDFIIKEESDKGYAGFINLIGIDSPGLTASPAIAEMVKGMI
ncbi:NAD(P)/FAD-dependent oxidoreductase [Elusimicrobiota bacterium]